MNTPYRTNTPPPFIYPEEPKKTPYVRIKSRVSLLWWARLAFALSTLLVVLSQLTGCSLLTVENTKTALDVAKVICVIANAESDDQTVKTVCGILDAENTAFQTILREHRQAAKRMASTKCGTEIRDAGADVYNIGFDNKYPPGYDAGTR